MKVSNKLTDEKLASLVELGFGKKDMDFSDLSSFEAFAVAENALNLVNKEEFADSVFSFDVLDFNYEPLAMCGFLGDESEEDMDFDDSEEENNPEDKTQ